MPYGLKIAVTIIGILLMLGTKMEIKNPTIKEIFYILGYYLFVITLIFLPWVINK